MPFANPVVARLAKGDLCKDEFSGLLLVLNWPASEHVQGKCLSAFSAAKLPASAYLYPPTSLHCTVASLRAFTAGPLISRESEAQLWGSILDAAASMAAWPTGPITLKMLAPTFEGAVGILRYEEVAPGGAIEAARRCLGEAISAAGGQAAVGGGDRTHCRPPTGSPIGSPAPHLPDIIHSTVLRWASEPTEPEVEMARESFEAVAGAWEPLEFRVDAIDIKAVFEDTPFMHIPHSAAQVFWNRNGAAAAAAPVREEK